VKKVLVTGATGFIGNYVVEELLRQSYTVIATSLNEQKAKSFPWFSKISYVPFDLNSFEDKKNYFQFFDQPDLMIHLAWEGLPNYKSSFHLDENLPRHLAFLSNLIRNGMQDLTVTGTCFEYGMQEGCLTEDMPAAPANPYALAKDLLRRQLEELKNDFTFSFKWVRLFYMYGKGQSPKSLFSQLDKAIEEGQTIFNMSGGEQVRDYLPVEKMVSYIVTVATQKNVTGIINCCSGKPVKLKDMVESYLRDKGANVSLNLGYHPYPDYEPMKFWGDNKKLKSILNE
jgi:dTDP-6-deoxy-L-talose 4-dehydrogenase (NAD+)